MDLNIGDLVTSEEFSGIGKVVSLDEIEYVVTVAFFESPLRSEVRPIELNIDDLQVAEIYDEAVTYYHDPEDKTWSRARYEGLQAGLGHLIFFRRDDSTNVPISDLYVLNLLQGDNLNPKDFLSSRCNDTPFFSSWRMSFIQAYIEQRASCKSISSIPSSSVELEPHQLAVVRRVLQDEEKKYLLADEVGLGKTIEACLILREYILTEKNDAIVVISVPDTLVEQWKQELRERFYLAELFETQIIICPHESLSKVLKTFRTSMLIIDEAHQIAQWAWSENTKQNSNFKYIAEVSNNCDACLLLSGTPLNGNERNFLAMLHLLSSDKYELDEGGVNKFEQRKLEREWLGGVYQALIPSNDNSTLSDLLENIENMFPNEKQLIALIDQVKPLIDWMAPEEGEERTISLKTLRKFIGENYRLHQRMLRNRREDSSIACLFPSLLGAKVFQWKIADQSLSVDQYLDAHRSEFFNDSNSDSVIASVGFLQWIKLALTSPMLVSSLAESLLKNYQENLNDNEMDFLHGISLFSKEEQIAKDELLVNVLSKWISEHPKGKAVIFCGDEIVANNVSQKLMPFFEDNVERHTPDKPIRFCNEVEIKILVCDQLGEDGLNLHGGEKLIIHYSLPISFDRIEQRNGRVNRYSATIAAKPIQGYVLTPSSDSLIHIWADILNSTVQIFDRSVASLQYVLEEHFEKAWKQVRIDGDEALLNLQSQLEGSQGILEVERQKVKTQEEINAMDEEVEAAKIFADNLTEADELAEQQSEKMFRWICRGLHFFKRQGEIPGTFRFMYNSDTRRGTHTQIDVTEFLNQCITGIDMEKSDFSNPVTALMSPDREIASHGQQVYPMRFGQPFIDTIFKSLQSDPRGVCSASIRCVRNLGFKEPKAYFNFHWLVSGLTGNVTHREQRVADEVFAPKVLDHWVDQAGKLVTNELVLTLLNADYKKDNEQTLSNGLAYQDINLRTERWSILEVEFPAENWPSLVNNMAKCSLDYVDEYLIESDITVNKKLESITVIFLVDMES